MKRAFAVWVLLGVALPAGTGATRVAAPAGASAQAKPAVPLPALRFAEASGCAGLFLYAWNEDRSEVLTLRLDRASVPLRDGTTTVNLATAPAGVAVRLEVTASPRESLPFCSDEQAPVRETPTIWTASAGTIKLLVKRRANAPFNPVSVSVDGLRLTSSSGVEVRQRRAIAFTAAIADIDQ